MASENEVDPLLCDECKALPPVDGLAQWPGMCGRCGLPMILDKVPGGEDAIEQARRGPVPNVAPCMTPEQAAVIREAERYVDSIGKARNPSVADLAQAVATMRGAVAPILARYDREIAHARSRGHVATAERIEAERDEYREAGQ